MTSFKLVRKRERVKYVGQKLLLSDRERERTHFKPFHDIPFSSPRYNTSDPSVRMSTLYLFYCSPDL